MECAYLERIMGNFSLIQSSHDDEKKMIIKKNLKKLMVNVKLNKSIVKTKQGQSIWTG